MEFKKVIKIIVKKFEKEKISYALIGGFALGLYGICRATVDLDFLVDGDERAKIRGILKGLGYKLAYESKNVLQFVSEDRLLGEIDFILALREISLEMLENAKKIKIFNKEFAIKVVALEDIIGLKLQAVYNSPKRYIKEYFDIESILEIYGRKMDWKKLEKYFLLFGEKEKFKNLKIKYEKR